MKLDSPETQKLLLLLPTCNSSSSLLLLHARILTSGLANHTLSLLPLLRSASLLLGPTYAASVLRCFPRRPTTFLFNTLISIFSSHRHPPYHSSSLYSSLVYEHRLIPNSHSFPSLLKSLSSEEGRCVHTHVVKFLGDAADGFVRAALVRLYGNLGRIRSARHLFDEMPSPDLAAWNAILAAYSRRGDDDDRFADEALELFREMSSRGASPDETTLVAVAGICGDVGALPQAAWAHAYVVRIEGPIVLNLNRFLGTALIETYAKCGRLDLARQLFDELPVKDTACYNAMLRGFAVHGRGHDAIELFRRMETTAGIDVNDVTTLAVMSACAHSGLVEDGRRCFDQIHAPTLEHYSCLVDLLGRAGRLEEAAEILRRMPMKPSSMTYRSLLGACRVHGKAELCETVVADLMKLDPFYGGNYVMLSNLYARLDKWDDVTRVRKEMKERGVEKTPGLSSVEVNGIVHEFSTDDRTSSY